MPDRSPLPVDAILPELLSVLADGGQAVLEAPTGAGKTTRVPPALLNADWLGGQKVIMLEPRRLAARAAARRIASERGERVGGAVGYRVRGDTQVSGRTRLEVVTEGVLTRMLLDDPALTGVGAVLFDEFHERSLQADLGLALTLQSRALFREDLRLVVMSATLDGERIAELLGGAPVVASRGRMFPVETEYLGQPNDRVEDAAAAAVRRALDEETGSVLVFLPGAGEIRRTEERLTGLPADVQVHPLYGNLSPQKQDAAVSPAPEGTRKVVLSTDIAETSLTIEGVRVVIDSGLARRPRFSPSSGMTSLVTVRISQASAEQRRGRAGRTQPGVCYRLWSEVDQAAMRPYDVPEIAQADLAPLALDLAAWGASPEDLRWLDPPPAAAFGRARELLRELGALDAEGSLTEHGRAMSELPMHPRLGHLAITAREMGRGALAADVVALLSERDLFQYAGRLPDVDLRLRVEALRDKSVADSLRGVRLHRGALYRARDESTRQRRAWNLPKHSAPSEHLHDAGLLLALAYPDRIAQKTHETAEGVRYRMRGGQGARLDPDQPLADREMLAIGTLDDRHGGARVFLAAPLEADRLAVLFADQIVEEDEVTWDERSGSVQARRVTRLGAVILQEGPLDNPDPSLITAALMDGVRQRGLEAALSWSKAARGVRERLAFLHHHLGAPWPDVSDEALTKTLEDWLAPYAPAARSLGDLSRVDLAQVLLNQVPSEKRGELEHLAPEHVTVPSGSSVRLDYSDPEAPVLAVKLQEVFGLTDTPRLLGGRLPVTMHLLSPARRPVQVTQDLAGFWASSYFDVRKDMRGRYPKHPWPENPLDAAPTAKTKRQLRRSS